jgi:hypothetical protein
LRMFSFSSAWSALWYKTGKTILSEWKFVVKNNKNELNKYAVLRERQCFRTAFLTQTRANVLKSSLILPLLAISYCWIQKLNLSHGNCKLSSKIWGNR